VPQQISACGRPRLFLFFKENKERHKAYPFPRAGVFRLLKAGEGQISAHLPSMEEPCTGPLAPEVLCGATALAPLHHASFPSFPEFLKEIPRESMKISKRNWVFAYGWIVWMDLFFYSDSIK